jgi:hypothetical protein
MPYDPSTDEIRHLQGELHKVRMDLLDERSERRLEAINLRGMLAIGAILAVLAIFWLGYAIYRVNERCSCG